MAARSPAADTAGDLFALTTYLHASCNRDLLDAIARERLTFNQVRLLEVLRSRRIRPTMQQAAKLMHVSQAAASRIVDDLARRDLVHREKDEDDYRAKRLVITNTGEETIARVYAARLDAVAAFADELTPDEREKLEPALKQLLARDQIARFRPAA